MDHEQRGESRQADELERGGPPAPKRPGKRPGDREIAAERLKPPGRKRRGHRDDRKCGVRGGLSVSAPKDEEEEVQDEDSDEQKDDGVEAVSLQAWDAV